MATDFLAKSAKRLYEELDDKEIIGRISDHPDFFQEDIERIIGNHMRAFLLEHWPDVQRLEQKDSVQSSHYQKP